MPSLDTVIDIVILVLGGALAATGLTSLIYRLVPRDRRPYDFGVGVPCLAVVAGVGGSLWKLLPQGGALAEAAFLIGVAALIVMSVVGLRARKEASPPPGS